MRGCLERVVPQARAGDVEIIVVDGSGRGLDAAAAEQVTWLRCPGRGPHELRFRGLAEARGDVIAITEDHCDVPPDWCRQTVCAHARHPDALAIAGAVTNGATSRAIDRASFLLVHGSNAPGGSERSTNWFPPAGSNVSYKRERVLPLPISPVSPARAGASAASGSHSVWSPLPRKVEMMGLEPTTSSMPWRRSTRLSYIPETAQSTSEVLRLDRRAPRFQEATSGM